MHFYAFLGMQKWKKVYFVNYYEHSPNYCDTLYISISSKGI